MADGDEITIPYQPGQGPGAGTATAAPDAAAVLAAAQSQRGEGLPASTEQGPLIPEEKMQTLDDLKKESWGAKIYHGVLNALGGKYNTQFIQTPNGVVQQQVQSGPGQQWKNIISGALSGFGAAAAGAGTGPGSTMRGAGLGVQAGYQQRKQQSEDEREAALKMATSNAQTALMGHQIAESTWRLENEQRTAQAEVVDRLNTFNQLVADSPGSRDLGSMSWADAQRVAKEWPQIHHEHAQGRLVMVQDVGEDGKLNGRVRVAQVSPDWQNSKTDKDYTFPVETLDEKGNVVHDKFTVPAGAYTNGDLSKLIMAQSAQYGQRELEQTRTDIARKEAEDRAKLIPSDIAAKQSETAKNYAEAAAAQAKAQGGDVEWGPGGEKGFNSWHDKNVTPALQSERLYRLSSNIYNEYQGLRAQGKNFPTGAQSVQMLSNHIAGTFGNVKGARITKDLIEKHLGARSISDSALTAVQRITSGQELSPAQWDAFFEMIGQNRAETWRSVLEDAQALGRPTDYIAFPTDLRQRWALGPGHVPGATGMMPGEAVPAPGPRAPGAAAGPQAGAGAGAQPSGKSVSLAAAMALPGNKGKTADQVKADIVAHGHEVAP
jgi:hypothetical protein